MLDIRINNVTVIDGTGAPGYGADIGVRCDRIVMCPGNEPARCIIDGTGKLLTPGFIDAHSHGDEILGTDFGRLCKVNQGITTEIAGQCGESLAPVFPAGKKAVMDLLSTVVPQLPAEFDSFDDYGAYMHWADSRKKSANIKCYVGHGTVRVGVMGYAERPAVPRELEQMKALVRNAMENGALGLSSGLIYTPSCYAETDELVELCKVVAEYGGVYASHIRGESSTVVESVREALTIGRRAGVPVFISHHKVCGKPYWGLSRETLRLVDEAKAAGQQVTIDQYPYPASMTNLNAAVPPWYFGENGVAGVAGLMSDREMRSRIRREIEDPASPFENQYLNCGGWDGVLLSTLPKTPEYEGITVAQAAQQMGTDPFEAYFDLLRDNDALGTAIYFCIGDEDMDRIFLHPDTCVGTDGIVMGMEEKGHPRGWAAFPRAIRTFHKEKALVGLEEMIRKITGFPAQRAMLEQRGEIRDGWYADLVLLDYDALRDRADFITCHALSDGIECVIVNGEIVYRDKKLMDAAPGRVLRHRKPAAGL